MRHEARRKLYLESVVDAFVQSMPTLKQLSTRQQLEAISRYLFNRGLSLKLKKAEGEDKATANNMTLVALVIQDYLDGTASIYKIADEFGRQLKRTDLDVPCSLLRGMIGKSYILEFPDSVTFPTPGGKHKSCVVTLGVKSPAGGFLGVEPTTSHERQTRALYILAQDCDMKGNYSYQDSHVSFPLPDELTLSQALNTVSDGGPTAAISRDMVAFVAKCLLYIGSGEPDLKKEPAKTRETKNPKKLKALRRNFYPLDIVTVGYSFHGKTYNVDGTQVSGHFRWQRCGVEYSQVKLIWIDEHARHFNRLSPIEHRAQ